MLRRALYTSESHRGVSVCVWHVRRGCCGPSSRVLCAAIFHTHRTDRLSSIGAAFYTGTLPPTRPLVYGFFYFVKFVRRVRVVQSFRLSFAVPINRRLPLAVRSLFAFHSRNYTHRVYNIMIDTRYY